MADPDWLSPSSDPVEGEALEESQRIAHEEFDADALAIEQTDAFRVPGS